MSTGLTVFLSVVGTIVGEGMMLVAFVWLVLPRIMPRLIHRFSMRAARNALKHNTAYGKAYVDSVTDNQSPDYEG